MSTSATLLIREASLEDVLDLRHAVLRPGMTRETAIFAEDPNPSTRHFAAYLDGRIVACASLMLNEWDGRRAWQLRGMAVKSDLRRSGVGRTFLDWIERWVIETSEIRTIWCNARVPAIGFYEKNGWTVVSEVFEVPHAGPHRKMVKALSP